MKNLIKLAASIGLIWYLVDRYQDKFSVDPARDVPDGAKPTGRIAQTTGGGPPGEDVVGYDPKRWMEVVTPVGEKLWVELKSKARGLVGG